MKLELQDKRKKKETVGGGRERTTKISGKDASNGIALIFFHPRAGYCFVRCRVFFCLFLCVFMCQCVCYEYEERSNNNHSQCLRFRDCCFTRKDKNKMVGVKWTE